MPERRRRCGTGWRRSGRCWGEDIRRHSALVKDAYRPLLERAPKDGIEVIRDLAYGSDPRQVLDVFRSGSAPAGGLPVAIFVHGGAFVRGSKRTDEELYDNVLYWFARQGFLGINLEYRLAPQSTYPGGADDVAAAVAWLHVQVARWGGDPQRLLLIGHSAGGTHAASYVFDTALGYRGRHLAGLVLISARLRADDLPVNPNADAVKAYFGDDSGRYDERSPVSHCAGSDLPVFVVIAEFENPLLDVYGLEMAYRLAASRGRAPRFLRLGGHNHMSIMAHFNTGEELLGREIIDFFRSIGI